ncbi:MAG TPA: zf-HC2 domain-containing protein [Thermoanaerobaculia bacterium]|nr:zf-HC2 domain-containing protein [Thermoanaerobaculia bacterium]
MSELNQASATTPGGPGQPGHPELEELAALIDGRLAPAAAARVRAHLASCEECFELVAETLHVQEALKEKDTLPYPFDRHRQVWFWPAAAAAVLVAALAIPFYRSLHPPDYSVDAVALRLASRAEPPNQEGATRGAGHARESRLEKTAFRSGAATLLLQHALRSGDLPTAETAATKIAQVLGLEPEIRKDGTFGPLHSSELSDRGLIDFYGGLRSRLKPPARDPLARETAGRAATLRQDLGVDSYFDFGVWVMAGKLAARGNEAGFFASRDAHYFLSRLAKEKDIELPPQVRAALEAVDRARSKEPIDLGAVQKNLDQILSYYESPDPDRS